MTPGQTDVSGGSFKVPPRKHLTNSIKVLTMKVQVGKAILSSCRGGQPRVSPGRNFSGLFFVIGRPIILNKTAGAAAPAGECDILRAVSLEVWFLLAD